MHNLGVTQWFLDVGVNDSLPRASELGFKYIHISSFAPDDKFYIGKPSVVNKYKSQIKACGISVTGISISMFEEYGIPADLYSFTQTSLYKTIVDTIQVAKVLEAKLIYLPSFNKAQIKNQHDLQITSAILNIILKLAMDEKINIATENTLDAANNELLLNFCANSKIKILLDLQNPIVHGHDICSIINRLKFRFSNQVHIKDGVDNILGNARLGAGGSYIARSLKILNNLSKQFIYFFENDYRIDAEQKVKEDTNNFIQLMAGSS